MGNGYMKAQSVALDGNGRLNLAALHWSERTEPSARSPSVLAHYCTLTSIGFGFFATALFGR
jgi:hypothetical protein